MKLGVPSRCRGRCRCTYEYGQAGKHCPSRQKAADAAGDINHHAMAALGSSTKRNHTHLRNWAVSTRRELRVVKADRIANSRVKCARDSVVLILLIFVRYNRAAR